MCQLTFMGVNDKEFTRLCMTIALTVNSMIRHKDGTGIATKDKKGEMVVNKTLLAASELDDIVGTLINSIQTDEPVIGHVRLASVYKKDLKEEHAHPFLDEASGLTLAHNGTLELKSEFNTSKIRKETDNMIDSQVFLYFLSREYLKKKVTLVQALKSTMEKFSGKFAFVIYEKKTNNYFIIRGKTADLHIVEVLLDGEHCGIMINTEKDSLKKILLYSKRMLKLRGKDYSFGEIQLLPPENIFRFKKEIMDLVVIGEIVENTKTVATTVYTPSRIATKVEGTTKTYYELINGIHSFRREFQLSMHELDTLFHEIYGKGLLYSLEKDLADFITDVIPDFEMFQKEDTTFFRKMKWWRKINTKLAGRSMMRVYDKYPSLKFPYFFSNIDTIHEVELDLRAKIRKGEAILT